MACITLLAESRPSNPCKQDAGMGSTVLFGNRPDLVGLTFNATTGVAETLDLDTGKFLYKFQGARFGSEFVAGQSAGSRKYLNTFTFRGDWATQADLDAIEALAAAEDLFLVFIPSADSGGAYRIVGLNKNGSNEDGSVGGIKRDTSNIPTGRNDGDDTAFEVVFTGVVDNAGFLFKPATGTTKAYFDALLAP